MKQLSLAVKRNTDATRAVAWAGLEFGVPVTYRAVDRSDYDAVRQLLIALGWGDRVRDRDRFELMMTGATKTVGAFDGDRLVGFGRVITDGASNGYISTVAVVEDRQRQGIGRELVARLMDVGRPQSQMTWVLRAGRQGADAFWQKLGFRPSTVAMERVRTE
jgi:GNAT superfamily N-acetyltransferase